MIRVLGHGQGLEHKRVCLTNGEKSIISSLSRILKYVPLLLGEPSQPPNSSWPPSQNEKHAESTPAANLTFSPYYQHSSPVAAMFIVAYVLIFLLCMAGNTLVCFIVLKNRNMRTVTNVFILNLAVSDLLVGIFCMPTTLVDNLITGEYSQWRR